MVLAESISTSAGEQKFEPSVGSQTSGTTALKVMVESASCI